MKTSAQLAPIASLLSKSEKALQKLSAGTWQHKLLRDNLASLRIAHALMEDSAAAQHLTPTQLAEAVTRLAEMAAKSLQAQPKFAPGSAQHTLLQNRIAALRTAEKLVRAAAPGRAL